MANNKTNEKQQQPRIFELWAKIIGDKEEGKEKKHQ